MTAIAFDAAAWVVVLFVAGMGALGLVRMFSPPRRAR
jgi:hypothetical protein